ncbi:MAG TPA: hypothetical protein VF881_17875 [Polyangiaceae bacterium]
MTKHNFDPENVANNTDGNTSDGAAHDLDLLGAARARLAAMAGMRRVLEELDRAIEAGQVEKAKALLEQLQRTVDAASTTDGQAPVRISEIRYANPKEGPGSNSTAKSR